MPRISKFPAHPECERCKHNSKKIREAGRMYRKTQEGKEANRIASIKYYWKQKAKIKGEDK